MNGNIAGAVAWQREHNIFNEGVLSSVIGMVNCSGGESKIVNCDHIVFPPCGRYSDAGVLCQGKTIILLCGYIIMIVSHTF